MGAGEAIAAKNLSLLGLVKKDMLLSKKRKKTFCYLNLERIITPFCILNSEEVLTLNVGYLSRRNVE